MEKPKSSPSTPPISRLDDDPETPSQTVKSLIVGPSSSSATFSASSKNFKLPDDWVVERRTRARSNQVDKYYFEPGTGRMFRSLLSIQRYLNQETKETLLPGAANNMQIVPHTFRGSPSFKLPSGWVIEERTRNTGKIDKYYIEAATGQRFRSQVSVERYLAGWEEYRTPKALKTSGVQGKKKRSGEEAENSMLDFTSPPSKVKWVLTSPLGNTWSPFIADSEVPEFIKQKWSEILISSVHNES